MGYVGNEPTSNFASVTKDSFSGDGSTTAFTLSKASTTNGVAVFVENVRQEPTTAYAVSGTTLTFTAAPVSASGNNIYVLHHNAPASTAIHSAAQPLTATSGTFTGAFTSLGIDDDATETAIKITSDEAVGIGTSLTPNNNSNYQVLTIGGGAATTGSAIELEDSSGNIDASLYATGGQVALTSDPSNGQGSSLISMQVDGTARMTIGSGGDVDIETGDIFFSTAGKGIVLGATSNTDANTLDDYEEGTWTAGSAVGTLGSTSDVIYTKVGRMVHFHVKGAFSNSSNSEAVEITGLPFAPSTAQVAGSAMWRDLGTNFQGGVVYVTTNSRISFFDDGTTSSSHNQLYHNEIGSSNEVVVSGSYMT